MAVTEQDIDQALLSDPDFMAAEPQMKVELAKRAYGAAGIGRRQNDQKMEQPEVLGMGQQPPQYSGTSEELAKGLLEVGGMMMGGPIGGKLAVRGAEYLAPKVVPYIENIGRTIGSGIGGGAAAAGSEAFMPSSGETWPKNQLFPDMRIIGKEFERGAIAGSMAELGGQGLVAGAQALKGQVGRMISGVPKTGLVPDDAAALQTAQGMGVTLRPSEVTANDVAAQIEQNARRSMFGKNKFQQLDIKNEAAFRTKIEDYADATFSKVRSPQESGRLIQDAIENKVIPDWQAVNRGLYQRLAQETKDQKIVPMFNVYDKARNLSASIDPRIYPKSHALAQKIEEVVSERGYTTGLNVKTKYGAAQQGPTIEGPPIKQPIEGLKITEKSEGTPRPRNINFMEAHDARSLLLEINRTGEGLPKRVQAVAGTLAKSIDDAMEQSAQLYDKANGTHIENMWRVANASTKYGHELFDSEIVRTALKKNPEDVARVAFNKDAITETDRIMEILAKEPATKAIYQRAAVAELLKRATGGAEYLNGQSLWNAAYGKNGVGAEVMRRTLGVDQAARLKEFLEVGRRMNISTLPTNAGNPSQTGRTLINWFEQGMVIQLPVAVAVSLSQGQTGAAMADIASTGAYILTIDKLAKLLNSEEGTKLLIQGMRVGPKAQVATRIATGILAVLGTKEAKAQKDKRQ